jgi:hypothetical protein
MDCLASSTASTSPATAPHRLVRDTDIWDLEVPVFDARAAATVVRLITDEMLRFPHPTIKMEDYRVLMIDDRTVEALHYALARLEDSTGAAADAFNMILASKKAAKEAAAA